MIPPADVLELADQPHGVMGPTVAVMAQAVDGDDSGMVEPAGDLGLDHESMSVRRVFSMVV